ncbi:hypothetical protein FA95DRAFT_1348917 [Auriscalpium vulgare]|uniref:Uncharacterized protein n=1 Tax=Auriscalpium vulgare TaxID=40419 RepID=A0ACB8R1I9_9AGAM|nr:hypothetical protein FA95DRAFT_1348917 [Auriscalpium vulgare]
MRGEEAGWMVRASCPLSSPPCASPLTCQRNACAAATSHSPRHRLASSPAHRHLNTNTSRVLALVPVLKRPSSHSAHSPHAHRPPTRIRTRPPTPSRLSACTMAGRPRRHVTLPCPASKRAPSLQLPFNTNGQVRPRSPQEIARQMHFVQKKRGSTVTRTAPVGGSCGVWAYIMSFGAGADDAAWYLLPSKPPPSSPADQRTCTPCIEMQVIYLIRPFSRASRATGWCCRRPRMITSAAQAQTRRDIRSARLIPARGPHSLEYTKYRHAGRQIRARSFPGRG